MESKPSKSKEQLDEDSTSRNLRMGAAIAFAFVLLVMGVPLWWKMTEVKRHPLPNARIVALNDISLSIIINVSVHSQDPVRTQNIINGLSNLLNTSELFKVNLKPVSLNVNDIDRLDVSSLESMEKIHSNDVNSYLLLETSNLPQTAHAVALGAHRTIYFKPSASIEQLHAVFKDVILQEAEMYDSMKAMIEPGFISKSLTSKNRVRTSTNYDVIFSVVSSQPNSVARTWNIRRTLTQFISPLLEQMSAIAHFNLKSQWLHFIDLEQIAKKNRNDPGPSHVLSDKHLPHLISPLEKKLGSGVAKHPCIHFVLYATPCQSNQLYFESPDGSIGAAMLSARWGGIQLLQDKGNVGNCNSTEPYVPNDNQVMSDALLLLRMLLGLQNFSKNALILNSMDARLNLWELDYLIRLRSLEQFAAARLTLNSLARLLNRISNIVITEEVSQAVCESVDAAEKVINNLQLSNASEALKFSKIAFNKAEYAFTHPSLLALLYFPDDQKYAVYIPLFLPIMIPVLLSMKSMRPWFSKKEKGS
nr:PREDICTED: GPI transamidase component PIG-S [Bemisia tabaci]